MLRWYFLNDLHWEIIRFYKCMRKCRREHDNVVFSIMLKACCELRDFDEGRKLHCLVVKMGSPDSYVLTGLVDMYAKCGKIGCSREVFDEIVDHNVVSWTSMIAGYVQNDCSEEGLILFNRMREALVESNQYTLGSLVTACGKLGALHQGKWVHGYAIKKGIDFNSCLVTALVDMYVKCAVIKDARSVFDELSCIDLVSWTAMIVGYSQSGHPTEALKLFIKGKCDGFLPNSTTAASVLSACAQLGNLNLGRSVHALGIQLEIEDNAVGNALVDMYAKCLAIEDAKLVFEKTMEKDVISWNSMISGYSRNGCVSEALKLFNRMRFNSYPPDAITVVGVLSVCASQGVLQTGCSLHAYSVQEGFMANVYVGTALLNLYAKCGDAKSAREIFDGMDDKSTITWSSMISGYGMQGESSILHSRLDLGQVAARRLLDLHPTESCYYVLLSNLYASDGRWFEANQVRELMIRRRLSKSPGHSLVEMETDTDLFSAYVHNLVEETYLVSVMFPCSVCGRGLDLILCETGDACRNT
ncbi:E motif [Dillenia turbinata]|uniref:E motif n=1 Tax=Dillenia turbinata TaxID=194707 RepID=A0AAN8URR3_9MAGN